MHRYRRIIPDFPRFLRVLETPEPTFLRVRTGRVDPAALVGALEAQGFRMERVHGPPDVFRVTHEPFPVSLTLEHWRGLFYVQQAVTALAAPALAPRPGERILDLCAAPGGKTTHLADLVDDRGTVVAADRDEKRIRGLLGNLYRTAHPSVVVVAADGREFPDGVLFDRVLVDAPCSAEGNLRDRGGAPRRPSDSFRRYVTGVQEGLLRRAVELTRPGGTILYCTCTFAPEENEGVVSRVLADAPVSVEPIDLEAPHAPGLPEFGGRAFHPDLAAAWRLYPHHLDSGGLFMARLRKDGDGDRDDDGDGHGDGAEAGRGSAAGRGVAAAGSRPESSGPETGPDTGGAAPAPRDDLTEGLSADERRDLEEEFGVDPAALDSLRWTRRGDSVWAHRADAAVPGAWGPDTGAWRLLSLGLRALRPGPGGRPRPTNDLLRWLGDRVGRRRLDLPRARALALLAGEPVDPGEAPVGPVALALEGTVVGRAVVFRDGRAKHEIPRSRARGLRRALEIRAERGVASEGSAPPG